MRYVTVIAEFIDQLEDKILVYNSASEPVSLDIFKVENLLGETPEEGEEFVFQIPVDLAEQNGLYWE